MKPRVWVCLLLVLTAQPLLFAESLNTDGAQQDLASFDCDRGEPVSTTFDNSAGWDLCLINTERENLLKFTAATGAVPRHKRPGFSRVCQRRYQSTASGVRR